jgi:hypothetical protein
MLRWKWMIAILALTGMQSLAHAGPITNGGFETTFMGFTPAAPGLGAVPGWGALGIVVVEKGAGYNNTNGAVLSGLAALFQTFTSTGPTVQFQFVAKQTNSGFSGHSFTPGSFVAQLNGQTETLTATPTAESGWIEYTSAVIPVSSIPPSFIGQNDITLSFVSTPGSLYDNYTLSVDNVSLVTPTPEPATLAVFGSLAAAGALYVRRRRSYPAAC